MKKITKEVNISLEDFFVLGSSTSYYFNNLHMAKKYLDDTTWKQEHIVDQFLIKYLSDKENKI